ncbi:zinc finger MYM-type protein 1-like [Aphis craccivora]|uniref:Zinc finger MYM-type protein 1-like n=1 Tax=Aphis craccivora TaxID=307492 RepID=A0A6G0Y1Q0_APHCR|nr:zinc finger MYM-type protein 1-like [Aphis craccivora]
MKINNSDFTAIIVDETTDVANTFQLALIFRYGINGKFIPINCIIHLGKERRVSVSWRNSVTPVTVEVD